MEHQASPSTCHLYRDVFGGWRWEAGDANGESVDSRQSFSSLEECMSDASHAGYVASGPASRSGLCALPENNSREFLEVAFASQRLVFAHSGYEAMRSLHAGVFDFYVLEFWLPDFSGVALCREIRKVDPSSPIVFCTATDREDARRRALNAGATAYLCHPVEPQVLRERIKVLLDRVDAASLSAKREEELAIEAELSRRMAAAAARTEHAQALIATATERAARAKAFKVFIESGGTRANFERWWPQVLTTAWATHRIHESK